MELAENGDLSVTISFYSSPSSKKSTRIARISTNSKSGPSEEAFLRDSKLSMKPKSFIEISSQQIFSLVKITFLKLVT